MFERKLERDQVRPFHHPVQPGHPTRFEGGTRPAVFARRPTATSRVHRKMCPADPHGIRARASKGAWVRGPERRRCLKTPKDAPSRRQQCQRGTCFIAVATLASRQTLQRTPRHHGRRRDPQPNGWTVSDEEAGAERSEALSPLASSQSERQERRRTNKDFVRWDAGAQRARCIHLGSNPAVEGPRRGPKPSKDRPVERWKRRAPVRTHLRSNASKVLHHAVATRASKPVTEATKRSRLRGKRTSRGQRSWRHETAAGGGNPLRGMKRATRTRNSRDPLHTDQQWPGWGAGSTRMTTRNVANPRIGSGMQQARESCASNGAKLCASRAIGGESRRDRENR